MPNQLAYAAVESTIYQPIGSIEGNYNVNNNVAHLRQCLYELLFAVFNYAIPLIRNILVMPSLDKPRQGNLFQALMAGYFLLQFHTMVDRRVQSFGRDNGTCQAQAAPLLLQTLRPLAVHG